MWSKILFALTLLSTSAFGQYVSKKMAFQGKVNGVADGAHNVSFTFKVNGVAVGNSISPISANVSNGIFSIVLDGSNVSPALDSQLFTGGAGQAISLDVNIDGTVFSAIPVTTVPSAFVAEKALSVAAGAVSLGAHAVAFGADGTFTVPTGVDSVIVEAWGAGGGGGGGGVGAGCASMAGGGGGGSGTYIKAVVPVSSGANISVTIGAPGGGGAASSSGGNGGSTLFGGFVTAPGGGGGAAGTGGAAGSAGAAASTAGATSLISFTGTAGAAGMAAMGYGGSGAGSFLVGVYGTGSMTCGGAGGNGTAATGYGAGGGGGGSGTGTAGLGGAGAPGYMIVYY